jgi:hypothetical protein
MSRKDIFAMLVDNYDIPTELKKIACLFNKQFSVKCGDGSEKYTTMTIENAVNNYGEFCAWKSRKGCFNCGEMRNKLELFKNPNDLEKLYEDIRELDNSLSHPTSYFNRTGFTTDKALEKARSEARWLYPKSRETMLSFEIREAILQKYKNQAAKEHRERSPKVTASDDIIKASYDDIIKETYDVDKVICYLEYYINILRRLTLCWCYDSFKNDNYFRDCSVIGYN